MANLNDQITINDIRFIEMRVSRQTRFFGGVPNRSIDTMVGTFKNKVAYDIYLDGQKIAASYYNEDYIWRTRKDAEDAIEAANRGDRHYFIVKQKAAAAAAAASAAAKKRHQDEQAEVAAEAASAAANKRHQDEPASAEQQEEHQQQEEEEGGGSTSRRRTSPTRKYNTERGY